MASKLAPAAKRHSPRIFDVHSRVSGVRRSLLGGGGAPLPYQTENALAFVFFKQRKHIIEIIVTAVVESKHYRLFWQRRAVFYMIGDFGAETGRVARLRDVFQVGFKLGGGENVFARLRLAFYNAVIHDYRQICAIALSGSAIGGKRAYQPAYQHRSGSGSHQGGCTVYP